MVEEEVGGVLPGPLVGAEMSLKATSCLTLAGRDATGNILHNKFSVVGTRARRRAHSRALAHARGPMGKFSYLIYGLVQPDRRWPYPPEAWRHVLVTSDDPFLFLGKGARGGFS